MKTLYLECNMGAAGDMLMAALYELLPQTQKDAFLDTMNRLLPGGHRRHSGGTGCAGGPNVQRQGRV